MRETTNYGLKITEGNDDWRDVFDDNADNMETIDEAMADGAGKAGRELLGYKENGNTASRTIAIGKFVVWKGNLYKAKVAIPQGTAFSTSNLTAVGDGGFNELQTKIGDVGNTDLQSQVNLINSSYANKGNGGAHTPAFNAVTIVGTTAAGVDVLTWGGGNESANSGNNAGGIMYDHATRRYQFRAKDTSNAHYHQYLLPDCSSAQSNQSYDILTSEVYPFVRAAGGSPGGSSNQITFTALNGGRHAILCYAANMSHIFCATTTDSTVYSDGIASGFTLTKSNETYTLTRDNATVFSYVVLWI